MSSVINLLRFTANDFATDQLTLTQGAIIWGNDDSGTIKPEILSAPDPPAKKFLSISELGIITWEDLDTNSSHPVNQDVGTNATKWIIGYTAGNAATELHIIWTTATNLVELKRGDGSVWNNLKVAGLTTTAGITCGGAITGTGLTVTGNGSFTGTLNADGNWNLGTWGTVLASAGTIESNVINAKSTFLTLNYNNDKRNTDQGGYKYKYGEGISDYLTWYYSGDTNNITWSSNKPINLATGNDYRIDQKSVLSNNTLGSGILYSSLTSVDTITSGKWESSPIGPSYGGTGMSAPGTANQLVGMDAGGSIMEYKTITVSNGLSLHHDTNSISISGAGIQSDTYLMKPRPDAKEGYLFADANDTNNDGIMRIQRASTLSGLTYTYNNLSPALSWVGLDWSLYNIASKHYFTDSVPRVNLSYVHYALLYSHDDTTQFKVKLEELLAIALDRASTQITVPASSDSAGNKSVILYDDDYLYICVATDSWKRIPLSTFS